MKLHLPSQEVMISSDYEKKKNGFLSTKAWELKGCFAREKMSEFIEEIWEGTVQVVLTVDNY
jgi:hypothetical protein